MALHPCCPKRKVSQISSTVARAVSNITKKGKVTYDILRPIVHYNRLKPFFQASPHGEQESSEEEEKGTPSEEQESRGEEINKEPQESMADLQDE